MRVVPVHLDSNLQRGRFRPCVDGMLAKTFGQGGIQVSCMESHLNCSISREVGALLCRDRPREREENASSVVPDMPSGAVETQWQVPAVKAIAINVMVLHCLGPMKAPRAGVKGRVVWASRFRGPGMATKECWGAPLHQLVHNPETGDATGSCSLAGCFFFFFLNLKFVQAEVFPESESCTSQRIAVQSCRTELRNTEKHGASQKPTRSPHCKIQSIMNSEYCR